MNTGGNLRGHMIDIHGEWVGRNRRATQRRATTIKAIQMLGCSAVALTAVDALTGVSEHTGIATAMGIVLIIVMVSMCALGAVYQIRKRSVDLSTGEVFIKHFYGSDRRNEWFMFSRSLRSFAADRGITLVCSVSIHSKDAGRLSFVGQMERGGEMMHFTTDGNTIRNGSHLIEALVAA